MALLVDKSEGSGTKMGRLVLDDAEFETSLTVTGGQGYTLGSHSGPV